MTDILLKFPDKSTAVQVGAALGFTTQNESEEWETTTGNETLAVLVIGHHAPEGEEPPADWWVLVRLLVEMELPEAVGSFVMWRSDVGEEREAGFPQHAWL